MEKSDGLAAPERTAPALNAHNKDEYPPMHTAEHILNQAMVRMFGCGRARSAHIERKKSKCDYSLSRCPTADEVSEIERRVNEVIDADLPVTIAFMGREEASAIVDLARLPKDASETLRVVRVGDYDACACIGAHVARTGEISESDGRFSIVSHDWADGAWRVRFRLAR
jgi:misacylated tRNA(Ala) deacylase